MEVFMLKVSIRLAAAATPPTKQPEAARDPHAAPEDASTPERGARPDGRAANLQAATDPESNPEPADPAPTDPTALQQAVQDHARTVAAMLLSDRWRFLEGAR